MIPCDRLRTFLFDGKKLISCSDDKTVKLMDALTGKELSSVQGKKKFTGPAGTIKMCAISPDGKRVIAILKDDSKNIKLWDSESGKEILTLRGHRHSIESLAFSPNGRKAASGGGKDDKTLRIWDIDLGKELVAIFDEHTSAINSCVFSPNGKWLLTSGHRALDLWDVQTGKKIVSLFGKQRIIEGFTFCSFSPDGKTIVSVSKKAMRLWDVETGTEIGNVNHRQNITRCAASPNSKTIVTISDNTTLMLWNYFTDKEAKFSGAGKIETEHTDKITTCAFSPDGRRIVSGGNDKVLITYDVKTGIKVSSFTEHADSIVSCRFLPDGTKVASVSSDSLVKIWDAATGKEIRTAMGQSQFYSKLVFCKFSPDGKLIASIDNRPCKTTIELWEALSGSRIISFPVNAKEVSDCDFSCDGNKIAFTSDKTIQLWNLGTGQEITSFSGHAEITKTCSFSPDGSRILSGSDDTTLKLWDAETGRELALFRGHTDKVQSCAFSPDGSRILSGSDDTTLKLWDAETRKEIISFCGHTGKIKMCAFSPNGKQIASIDNETLRLWDIHTGKDIKSFIGNYEANNCVFSPDGKIIIAGGHLWDIENTVENAIETASFAGHKSAVRMCTFSQDAKTMFSFAYGDTFKLWDTVSGREIAAFSGYPGAIKDCKVSPDSKKVLFSSESDDLKLWDIGNGREIASLPGTCNTEKFAFSPNSERIVTDCSEYVFKLWDADSGREIASLSSSLKVKAFAFSPDSNLIVFGGYDGKVYLWKATTDCRMFELMEQHEGPITSVAFSPDSKIIVSGGFDNTLMVRDAEKNYVITTFTGHAYQVKDCSFSPDGNTILSISDVDKVQKLWNAKNGREIASFVGDSDNTAFGSFSPDGKTFFLDSSHTLCLRDTQTGDEIFKLNGPANYKCIFSPDGKMIIGYGYGLMLWDSQTGKRIAFFHNSSRIAPLDISFCGNFIACGDYAGNMYLLALEGFINLAGNTEKSPTSDFPKNMAYNLIHKKTCYYELGFTEVINQGKYCEPVCKTETGKSEFLELASDMSFLVIGNKNQFEVWNIKSIPELMFKRNTDQPFIKIKISTDNKKIITIDDNYQLVSHNINKGTIETSYRYSTQRGTADKRYDFRDKDKVTKLNYAEKLAEIVPQRRNFIAFTKDYKHSLIWDTDRHPNLFFCDLDSGHTLLTTKENANEISFVSLTQDSRFSISVDADSKVNVWDMESGRIIQSLQNIGNNYLIPDWKHICPSKFQINPDGKHIITPNQTMEILTGSINSTILWSGSGEMGCFSNDGRYAYLIKNDNSVLIWNIKAGGDLCIAMGKKYTFHWTVTDRGKKINKSHEVERTISEDVLKRQSKVISLSGHTSKIKGIRISADDRIIITLSEDGSVRVWESCSGRCIYVFRIWAENISKMCNYNQFYYGDRYGKYRLMTLPNYTCDFAITTAIRSWQPKYRAWDTLLKYYCYWCGGIFTLEENFCKLMKHFEKRYNIKKKDSPSLRLPNEAWDDPNLMSKCPQCNRPLKFNPFVVDNISSSFRKTLLQKLGI